MNYEEFYAKAQVQEKEIRDMLANQQKFFKRMAKNLEKGDLKSALKDMTLLQGVQSDYQPATAFMRETLESFDAKEYMESGDYALQMLEYLEKSGVDAKGEHNVYEVFPYKVKLDFESYDVYINKRRVQCLRPQSLAGDIKSSRDKLMAVSFNPLLFASELAHAYDLAVTLKSKNKPVAPDADFYLTDLYKHLTPMRRFRREYDLQSFAFDLARLNSSDIRTIDDGRSFQFGPSREQKRAIRILDGDGHERFLATIRFYRGE
ncbi:MAG: hypothetical protein FWF85_00960 [Clostridiales bacterium]|jgi:hypothetical protein|nr:hypothetical protein [Clostridiales bacterium]MDR2713406.1 hypothetical protein [Clostridiales bacterium]